MAVVINEGGRGGKSDGQVYRANRGVASTGRLDRHAEVESDGFPPRACGNGEVEEALPSRDFPDRHPRRLLSGIQGFVPAARLPEHGAIGAVGCLERQISASCMEVDLW